nr:bifunctional diaminohydroxyphosphoribosylaminopyrimidine deaminase/5-amino-6-(5-phosphoribosylamino)uracil reductase RibD [Leucobacter chinensis]
MQQDPQAARREALEEAMRRALTIARRGPSDTVNPQVGCVILSPAPDFRVVAEGWHRGVGTMHAETDALAHLPAEWADHAKELTAVVTLEPCNHTGHTGPCALALIEAGIGHVVHALPDPGQQSSGGAERLREAGVEVISGVCEAEARTLLAGWLARQQHTKRDGEPVARPHVIAKWAQTLDGRAAAADGTSQWITGPAAREHVHAERALADAIAVATGTLYADDPSLTARDASGELLVEASLQPFPVVFGHREVPAGAAIRRHPALQGQVSGAPIRLTGDDLTADLATLGASGIRTLYVEGGPTLVSSLLAAGLVDELHVYLAPKLLGGERVAIQELGISSITDALHLTVTGVTRLGDDLLVTAIPENRGSDL